MVRIRPRAPGCRVSYTSIIDNMATAFNTAYPALLVETSYGQGITAPDQVDIVNAQGFRNVLIKIDDLPDDDVHNATFGAIQEGRAMMWSVAPTPDEALQQLETWWLTLCGQDGVILHNLKATTTLGSLDFLRWRAVGGFKGYASQFGNLWLADQLVEYTVRS